MSRAVIDVLKAATEPLTIRDIAERMLIARGNTKPDPKDVRKLETGFGPA